MNIWIIIIISFCIGAFIGGWGGTILEHDFNKQGIILLGPIWWVLIIFSAFILRPLYNYFKYQFRRCCLVKDIKTDQIMRCNAVKYYYTLINSKQFAFIPSEQVKQFNNQAKKWGKLYYKNSFLPMRYTPISVGKNFPEIPKNIVKQIVKEQKKKKN